MSVHYVAPSVLEEHLPSTQDVNYKKINKNCLLSFNAGLCGPSFSLHSWVWLYANHLVFGADGWVIADNSCWDGSCDKPLKDQGDQIRRLWFQTHSFFGGNGPKLQQFQLASVDHAVVRSHTLSHMHWNQGCSKIFFCVILNLCMLFF